MTARVKHIHDIYIKQCKQGHSAGYRQIYNLYSKQMFSVSLRLLKNREGAEDVLQESFMQAFKSIDSYRGDASFGSWLKRIVVNKCLNEIKKKKISFSEIKETEPIVDTNNSEGKGSLSVDEVKKATQKLPNGYRIILSLYLFEGYSHKEIGNELDISESTSKSQYSRAKMKLRTIIKEDYEFRR